MTMARPVETDVDRGRFVLAARGDIVNNGARVVEDRIRELLETGAWRSYTYPDGTHHEWLDREFDYFMCAWIISANTEWEYVKRNIVSPDVKLLLADHSGITDGRAQERRALDEIRDQFPAVHIEPITLVTEYERSVAAKDEATRKAYLAGQVTAHRVVRTTRRRWEVDYRDETSLAGLIVAKLERDPQLAEDVHRRLHAWFVSQSRGRKTS